MTDKQLRRLARVILATGFSAGTQWALSDKGAETCRATLDECLEENMAFFHDVANMIETDQTLPSERIAEMQDK